MREANLRPLCRLSKSSFPSSSSFSKREVSVPQPPALTRQVAMEEPPEPEEEEPQMTHAQLLRLHLAQVAQERRAQHHFRMVNPIRSFYGLG